MPAIHSFSPIEDAHARVLILGSMPGEASLQAGEYYAHARNHFWRLMGALLGYKPESTYAERVQALKSAGIAVWDVLHSCTREGSLDANIDHATLSANDFRTFFSRHKKITHVFFNGSAAEHIYRRDVLPALNLPQIKYQRLPSTSPANATYSFERKLEAWSALLQCALLAR
jgi:hypoxanthine-DNA glycosylase